MTDDTWSTRDLPVLRAVVDIYERTGRTLIRTSQVEQETGFDKDTVYRAIRALDTHPSYFDKVNGSFSGDILGVGRPTSAALRVAGAWPSPEGQLERLIQALESAAEDQDRDPDERGKLRNAATWLGSFASQVAIGALGGAGGNLLS
jgi:hypothetical protein